MATIRAGVADGVATPGSVEAWPLAPGLYEVVICNNYANNVSRHLVDDRDRCRVLGSEVLLAAGLDIPDGVSVSRDRRWLAVSNHNSHSVLLFRCSPDLAPDSQAQRRAARRGLPARAAVHGGRAPPRGRRRRRALRPRLRRDGRRLER